MSGLKRTLTKHQEVLEYLIKFDKYEVQRKPIVLHSLIKQKSYTKSAAKVDLGEKTSITALRKT